MEKEIGKRIKARRKALKLTQSELAEKMALSQITISRYETGAMLPSAKQIYKLDEVLGGGIVASHYEKAQEEIRRLRKQLASAQINNRIVAADVLEEVREQICDGYCKWPVLYGAMGLHDELLDGPCKHCPLDRL